MISASTTVTVDGAERTVTSIVDIDDIRANGIAWSTIVRAQAARPFDPPEYLGLLLNLASVCEAHELFADALGALRFARRIAGRSISFLDEKIGQLREAARFVPSGSASEFEIVLYDDEPDLFAEHLGAKVICENIYHPGALFGGLVGIEGARPIPPDPRVDNASFHVLRKGVLVATIPLVVHDDNIGSWVQWTQGMGGVPAQIWFACDNEGARKALSFITEYFDYLMRAFALKEVVIEEPCASDMLLYKALSPEVDFTAELWDRAVVDLGRPEDRIFTAVRKSYKSNINWCRDNLDVEYASGPNVTEAFVDKVWIALQQLHEKVVRRFGDGMTPNLFRLPLAMCALGMGEVAIARTRDGQVCALSVTTDAGGVAYYALAGSIPLENKKNPGHFIVYDSILRAKGRGNHVYHVSRLFGAPISVSGLTLRVKNKHELMSAFFKRGFSDSLDVRSVYRILPRGLTIFGTR